MVARNPVLGKADVFDELYCFEQGRRVNFFLRRNKTIMENIDLAKKERRRERRIEANVPVRVAYDNKEYSATLLNISRGGAAVSVSSSPPPVEARLAIVIGERDSIFHCALEGSVVMVRRLSQSEQEKRYSLHVKFDDYNMDELQPLAIFMQGLMAGEADTQDSSSGSAEKPAEKSSQKDHVFSGTDVSQFFDSLKLESATERVPSPPQPLPPAFVPHETKPAIRRRLKRRTPRTEKTSISRDNLAMALSLLVLGVTLGIVLYVKIVEPKHSNPDKPMDSLVRANPRDTQVGQENPVVPAIATRQMPDNAEDSHYAYLVIERKMTLQDIANNVYHNQDSAGLILLANPVVSNIHEIIPLGKTIRIPRYYEYTVRPGDTLGKIADQYLEWSKDYDLIFEENQDSLKHENDLQVGMTLKIPLMVSWAEDWLAGNWEESEQGQAEDMNN